MQLFTSNYSRVVTQTKSTTSLPKDKTYKVYQGWRKMEAYVLPQGCLLSKAWKSHCLGPSGSRTVEVVDTLPVEPLVGLVPPPRNTLSRPCYSRSIFCGLDMKEKCARKWHDPRAIAPVSNKSISIRSSHIFKFLSSDDFSMRGHPNI